MRVRRAPGILVARLHRRASAIADLCQLPLNAGDRRPGMRRQSHLAFARAAVEQPRPFRIAKTTKDVEVVLDAARLPLRARVRVVHVRSETDAPVLGPPVEPTIL